MKALQRQLKIHLIKALSMIKETKEELRNKERSPISWTEKG